MKARYTLPLLLIAAVGCQGGSQLAAKKEPTYDLKLRLQQGQTFAYMLTKVGQKENETASFKMIYKVKEVTPEAATIEMTFDHLEMNGADMTPLMRQMAGDLAMELKLNDRAETIDHKWTGGNEQFISSVGDMGGSLLSLPDAPIKIGDKWTGNVGAVEEGLPVDFELTSVEGNVAHIKATTKDTSTVKLAEPMQIELDISNGMVLSQKYVGELGSLGKGTYELRQAPVATAQK